MDAQLRPQRIDLPAGAGPPAGGSAVAYLLATGASTGIPKISARPGPLRYDPARTPSMVIRQAGWRAEQRQLIVGPLYHAAPFTAFVDALLDGNTVVLQPFFAAQWTVELVRRYAIEWLQLTPAHMREILRQPDLDPAGFASLRAMLHTASRCDADTKTRLDRPARPGTGLRAVRRDRGDRRDAGPRRRMAGPARHGRPRLPHPDPHSG